MVANINLNFHDQGKILDDYSIKGFVKKGKLHLLNREYLNNLNFDFEIKNKEYSLKNLIAEYKKLNIWVNSKNYNFVENLHQIILLSAIDCVNKSKF